LIRDANDLGPGFLFSAEQCYSRWPALVEWMAHIDRTMAAAAGLNDPTKYSVAAMTYDTF